MRVEVKLLSEKGRAVPRALHRTRRSYTGAFTLQETRSDDDDRRRDTDRRVSRHHGDRRRPGDHHPDRKLQRLLAPDPVGVEAEHNGAERAAQIGQAEAREGQEQRGAGIRRGKEQPRNDGGEIAVYNDFIPFERVAEDDREGRRTAGRQFMRLLTAQFRFCARRAAITPAASVALPLAPPTP